MPKVASWVRERDEPRFQRFFDLKQGMNLLNARRETFDPADCDGVMITGGPDISAGFLGQPIPDPALIEDAQPERDEWEFSTLRNALDRGVPVLAICKGHQVFNVALGGTLLLDIPNHRGDEMRHGNVQPLRYASGIRGARFDRVNSSHHQAIDKVGGGLEIEAWCATDDIVEQVRLRNYPYAIGVQFHPERDLMYAPLFEEFFAAVEETSR